MSDLAEWFHRELGDLDRHADNRRSTCEAWADQLARTFLPSHDAEVRAEALAPVAALIETAVPGFRGDKLLWVESGDLLAILAKETE